MGNFAKINDVAPENLKVENPTNDNEREQPRLLLSYIRCLECKEQFIIQTCAIDVDQRCSDFQDANDPKYNMHTHIMCKCGETKFSGVVSFRTMRDTDTFNVRRKLSWDEKKAQLNAKK